MLNLFVKTRKWILYVHALLWFLALSGCGSVKDYYTLPSMATETTVNAVVEIPAGTNKKYEYDETVNDFLVDKKNNKERIIDFLPYPANYGFIPSTLSNITMGGDGDALDILVISESLKTGSIIETIPIAILKLIDNSEMDYKIIAIPKDPNQRVIIATTYESLISNYSALIRIIELWFLNYNKTDISSIQGWGDEIDALNEIKNHIINNPF